MIDALTMLDRARSLVESIGDDEVTEWLSSGLDALQDGQDPRGALGLAGIDARQLRLARRNRWLRVAYEHTDHSIRPWCRCTELASQIIRFESTIAPRWRGRTGPPPDASELRCALFWAAKEGELPTSARTLYRICKIDMRT